MEILARVGERLYAFNNMHDLNRAREIYAHFLFAQNEFETAMKETLYRTARIAGPLLSSPELTAGQVVGITYEGTRPDGTGVETPVYRVYHNGNSGAYSLLYARALTDFCL